MYLLDTNTCIGWLRDNQPEVVARIQSHHPQDIVLCSMVVAELQYGIERSDQLHQANTALRVDQLRRLFISLLSMILQQKSMAGYVLSWSLLVRELAPTIS